MTNCMEKQPFWLKSKENYFRNSICFLVIDNTDYVNNKLVLLTYNNIQTNY